MKYSILLPTKNGLPYLRFAVNSCLETDRDDFELIVSIDAPQLDDYRWTFDLAGLDPRLRIVTPKSTLSMSEHWDFIQSFAKGEWQVFLGQDDLMMSGYLDAFDDLSQLADSLELKVFVGRRAYIFWSNVQDIFGTALQYWSTKDFDVYSSEDFIHKALSSKISYHEGPQMYTTSVVNKDLVSKIRNNNEGRLILGHPQDAFLAAAILKEAGNFLFSGSPFSWVGTSSRSAGLAITHTNKNAELSKLANEYLASVRGSSNLKYNSQTDFSHGVDAKYFYDALSEIWPQLLKSKRFTKTRFTLRFDSNLLSQLLASKKEVSHFKLSLLNQRFFFLTFSMAVVFQLVDKTKELLIKISKRVLPRILGERINFIEVRNAGTNENLFVESRKIRAGVDPFRQQD